MKKLIFMALFLMPFSLFADWSRPEVQCPEKVLPQGLKCLDLTRVKDPTVDFPNDMTPEERKVWSSERTPDLKLCRHQEVLRREEERAGSFTPLQIQIAWMITEGGKNPEQKLKAILKASVDTGMPVHVLLGAITQESLLSSLGISPDGGNFSCGIAQINIQEWCQGMMTLPRLEREALGWPVLECGALSSKFISPFFQIAKTKLGSRPEYRITASDFDGITLNDVVGSFPAASSEVQQKRFAAATSFIKNCQNDLLSIRFKATILKNLFTGFVPREMRLKETYTADSRYTHTCSTSYTSNYYPLHTGWLLAVAAYNAGPRVAALVEHYHKATSEKFPSLNPKDLIEALYWGGKVSPGTKNVVFSGMNGKSYSQSWYKSCVVQRHVARVIQHVARPGKTLARSLEETPCSQKVPESRLTSSGVK